MAIHFLISYKEKFMAGLHHRACDTKFSFSTRDRNKKQGSFLRRDVNCGNCERTDAFKKILKGDE